MMAIERFFAGTLKAEAEAGPRTADAKKPSEKKIRAIEKALEPLQREQAALDAWLSSDEAYAEGNREILAEKSRRHGEVAARIAQLEEDWLWTGAQMDAEVNRARQ